MRAHLLHVLILFAVSDVSAQIKPIDDKSTIDFAIRNFGIRVSGSFKGVEGNIQFDPAHIDQANFNIGLDANSVNTDNSMRDDHLRGESYLDIKHYPKIRFVSTKVVPSNKTGIWFLYGKLNIKGHERIFPFLFRQRLPWGAIFSKEHSK